MVSPAALRLPWGRSFCFRAYMKRVFAYIDGYNLYHAVHDTKQPHLKWLSLTKLANILVSNVPDASVYAVYYFSAYATWKPDAYKRHREYVAALKSEDVKVILGNFKTKPRFCKRCNASWFGHEEKETDVNIALRLLHDAAENNFDHALVISADTDLAPAIRFVREQFPDKHVTSVLPPGRQKVGALIKAANDHIRISVDMLARCLLSEVCYSDGQKVQRPTNYSPPK